MNAISNLIEIILRVDAWKATKFLTEKQIIRVTRKLHGRKFNSRDNIEISVTIGRPNFAERDFIKKCKKAGEKFPVKKVQLKFIPGTK